MGAGIAREKFSPVAAMKAMAPVSDLPLKPKWYLAASSLYSLKSMSEVTDLFSWNCSLFSSLDGERAMAIRGWGRGWG